MDMDVPPRSGSAPLHPSAQLRSGPRQGQIDQWNAALQKLLAAYSGSMTVRLPDGSSGNFGRGAREGREPSFTLWIRNPAAVRTLLLGSDPLRFAEAYFRSDIDVDGDLFEALALKDHLESLRLPVGDKIALLLKLAVGAASNHVSGDAAPRARQHVAGVKDHSKQENRDAIAFHYDLSNEFYGLWLGESMVYSCAYFEQADATLDQAQFAKLDHICRKLQLRPGEQLLDIGCGWGGLVLHAARHYGVQAHGITLSERQFSLATERVKAAGLQDRITIALQDYRDLPGEERFDKISSVGMFEHVGLKNLPVYFDTVHRLLKPQGRFMNHGITHEDEGWGKAVSSRFINRYVFPDGELDTISNIQRVMEHSKFEIVDVEGLRPHYAKTLRHWVQRLEERHEQALGFVNEATYRIWRLYMAACAMEFETGELGIYQILATKRTRGLAAVPLTRRYMYDRP